MRNTNYKNNGNKKKLSWIYRKKAKLQKAKNLEQTGNDVNVEANKRARIIVRNISFKATKYDIQKLYESFGRIEEINFPKRSDGTPVGCCFVEFKNLEDASKAIFNTNKKEYLGRVISSGWAMSKSKYLEKLQQEEIKDEPIETVNISDIQDTDKDNILELDKIKIKQEKDPYIKKEAEQEKQDKGPSKEKSAQEKQETRKLVKEKHKQKRARIVIRNLAFQATKEDLEDHFSVYGTIQEIKVLKRNDGKNMGCAFLQFEHVQSAAKAIHYANMELLLGRPIVVDWAVSKDKFSQNKSENELDPAMTVKEEHESDGEDGTRKTVNTEKKSKSKKELRSNNKGQATVTEADDSDIENITETEKISASETEVSENEKEDLDEERDLREEDMDDEEMDLKEEDMDEEERDFKEEVKDVKRPRFESHDVSEGKTVFLKNVPFSVKNDKLKQYMEQFGPVYYALVCMDSLTEYSKGTAFVKFKSLEDAEKCLSAGSELVMEDQIIEAHRALDRNDIENKDNSKKQKQKDSRNLYLVKEGVIQAGSPAAVGVSATDMAKRLQLEQWKSQILRNLNMFVARSRLVIHNLPPTLDDAKLKKIVERHCPPKAIIRETRVMRDFKNVDIKGVGRSKEYGFISFTRHEDALETLRSINNNPSIFTAHKRPIVSFSIENRVMVNAKQRRVEKSREQNPTWPGNKAKRKGEDSNEPVLTKKLKTEEKDESEPKPYAGAVGKLGENKFRSRYKLKTQALVHKQTVKKEKQMKKSNKKLEAKRRERIKDRREVKPKQGTKVNADDANLDKLVNRYKDKLKSVQLKKSKWFDS